MILSGFPRAYKTRAVPSEGGWGGGGGGERTHPGTWVITSRSRMLGRRKSLSCITHSTVCVSAPLRRLAFSSTWTKQHVQKRISGKAT